MHMRVLTRYTQAHSHTPRPQARGHMPRAIACAHALWSTYVHAGPAARPGCAPHLRLLLHVVQYVKARPKPSGQLCSAGSPAVPFGFFRACARAMRTFLCAAVRAYARAHGRSSASGSESLRAFTLSTLRHCRSTTSECGRHLSFVHGAHTSFTWSFTRYAAHAPRAAWAGQGRGGLRAG